MYLNIGSDYIINTEDIISVMDIDNTTSTLSGGKFLLDAQKNEKIINASKDNIPRTFIIVSDRESKQEIIYLSSITTSSIVKSIKNGGIFNKKNAY